MPFSLCSRWRRQRRRIEIAMSYEECMLDLMDRMWYIQMSYGEREEVK